MRLFKFASSFVKGLLLAAVLALMLAACSGAASAPTQATSATPPQGPANPVHPTPQPSPTPTPTPIPYSEMTGLQEMLAREFGAWPMLMRAEKHTVLNGEDGGMVIILPDSVFAAYKTANGYLIASDSQAGIVEKNTAEKHLGSTLENAPEIAIPDSALQEKIDEAKAWFYYQSRWQLPDRIDGLVDANGQPVDLHKFFNDRNYAVKIVSYYLTHDRKAYDVYGNLVPIKPRTDLDPNRVVDALWALYNSRFDPGVNFYGVKDPYFWQVSPSSPLATGKIFIGDPAFYLPAIDNRNDFHTNIDIVPPMNGNEAVVYNPFTQPAEVSNIVLAYYGKEQSKSLKEALEDGTVKLRLAFSVSAPNGSNVPFYITHMRADLGFGVLEAYHNLEEIPNSRDFLLKDERGNVLRVRYVSPGHYIINVNGAIEMEPGQPIAHLLDPAVDPLSQGWHIEFGPEFRIEDYRIATLMAIAMLYHPHPEQYLPPLPKEQGHWLGKKHVVSYQPTVPAVAVRQPNGTIAFANINPYKKEPGWKKQLPASASRRYWRG